MEEERALETERVAKSKAEEAERLAKEKAEEPARVAKANAEEAEGVARAKAEGEERDAVYLKKKRYILLRGVNGSQSGDSSQSEHRSHVPSNRTKEWVSLHENPPPLEI